ncbi:hypothetical protein H8E50_11165 [bacterium]|nr:hypothetical protein [bacterium]
MRTRNTEHSESLLENVQSRFDHWRRTRPQREAIPEDLWSAAVALAETYGVYKVAKSLRLNASSLKQRVSQSTSTPRKEVVTPSSFIEIPFIQSGQMQQCQVDILKKDGSRMQIRLPQAEAELPALVRAFLG